jgi:hypothetical protein
MQDSSTIDTVAVSSAGTAMAPVGQTLAHAKHPTHRSEATTNFK